MVQVLLAIQAQIMVETPLVNEPGFSSLAKDNPSNVIYNALQRIITMKVAMIGPMTNPYTGFHDLICKFFFGPKRLELIQQMYTWVQAAERITLEQCKAFIRGSAYNYISGAGSGAAGGVGLLPVGRLSPPDLRMGIIEMTKAHASKVLSLVYAGQPHWDLVAPAAAAPAPAPVPSPKQLIMSVTGADAQLAELALEMTNGDANAAVQYLLEGEV